MSATLLPQQTAAPEEPSHRADGRAFLSHPCGGTAARPGRAGPGLAGREVGGGLLRCDGAN